MPMTARTDVPNIPSLFLESVKTLWRPDIRWLVIVPLLINLLLFILLTSLAAQWLQDWIVALTSSVPQWLQWLAWLLWLIFALAAIAVYAFTFTLFANLIGAPFYGVIAQRIINTERPPPEDYSQAKETQDLSTLGSAVQSLRRELHLISYFLPRTLGVGTLAVICSFIPLLNLLAPVIAGSWAAWCLCLQYLDYAADADNVSFAELRARVRPKKVSSLIFGAATLIASGLPVANLIMLPASVVAGSLLWCRHYPSK